MQIVNRASTNMLWGGGDVECQEILFPPESMQGSNLVSTNMKSGLQWRNVSPPPQRTNAKKKHQDLLQGN